jgi:hypothetical protein
MKSKSAKIKRSDALMFDPLNLEFVVCQMICPMNFLLTKTVSDPGFRSDCGDAGQDNRRHSTSFGRVHLSPPQVTGTPSPGLSGADRRLLSKTRSPEPPLERPEFVESASASVFGEIPKV